MENSSPIRAFRRAPRDSSYCITSGEFGPEPLSSDAAVGRLFRLRITGATEASIPDGGNLLDVTCGSTSVTAALRGCIYRTKTSLL
jgi:hypothetical protein